MEHGWGSADPRRTRPEDAKYHHRLDAYRYCTRCFEGMRGALNNGVSPDEIREIIMHAAVYCGYPAALAAMKVAKEVVEAYQA